MMMKNVAIATDSHSSITPEMAQTLGVAMLPMPFTIDGTCYLEEETLTRAEFYAHQRRGAKIATSQPAPRYAKQQLYPDLCSAKSPEHGKKQRD